MKHFEPSLHIGFLDLNHQGIFLIVLTKGRVSMISGSVVTVMRSVHDGLGGGSTSKWRLGGPLDCCGVDFVAIGPVATLGGCAVVGCQHTIFIVHLFI